MLPDELRHFMKGFTESAEGGEIIGCEPVTLYRYTYPAFQVRTLDGRVIAFYVKNAPDDNRAGHLSGWKKELVGSKVVRGGCVEEDSYSFPAIEVQSSDGTSHFLKPTRHESDNRPGFFSRHEEP